MSTSNSNSLGNAVPDIPQAPARILRRIATAVRGTSSSQPDVTDPVTHLQEENVAMRVPYRVARWELAHVIIQYERDTYVAKLRCRNWETGWLQPRRIEESVKRVISKGKPFSFTTCEDIPP